MSSKRRTRAQIKRRILKKANRKVLAERTKAALTDKQVREKVAGTESAIGIESMMRRGAAHGVQGRAEFAEYKKHHVHVANPDEYIGNVAGQLPDDSKKPDLPALTKEQRKKVKEARAVAVNPDTHKPVPKAERVSESTHKAWEEEGSTLSASEGQLPITSLSKKLDRQSHAAADARAERERYYNVHAWAAFREDPRHVIAGAALQRIIDRGGKAAAAESDPLTAVALGWESYFKRLGRGREQLEQEARQYGQDFRQFRGQWIRLFRAAEEQQREPEPAAPPIPAAVLHAVYGAPRRVQQPARTPQADRRPVLKLPDLVAVWEADVQLQADWEAAQQRAEWEAGRGRVFRLKSLEKSLEEILAEIDTDWLLGATEGNELRERYQRKQAKDTARSAYWKRRHALEQLAAPGPVFRAKDRGSLLDV